MMKTAMKTTVVLATAAIGGILGIVFLDGFVLWKMPFFAVACRGVVRIANMLLSAINAKFQDADSCC